MSTKNKHNLSQKLKIRNINESLSVDSRLKSSFKKRKKNILFSNKANLVSLLNKIKNLQTEYISNKSLNINQTNQSILNTKQLLFVFKNNLNSMLKEKNIIYNYFKKENEKKKKEIQKKLYNMPEDINDEDNITIGNEKLYYSETSQLKLLNFQIENDIKNTDFLIERYTEINNNIKYNPFYLCEKNEIICNNKSNISKVSDILHESINNQRKNFITIVNKKSDQDMEIKSLSMEAKYLKERLEKNEELKFTITEDVMNEDSKDYTKNINNNTTYINRNYSNSSVNNKLNLLKLRSNDTINKNIYFINQEKFIRKKLIFSKTVSPKLINNIRNNLNNNMLYTNGKLDDEENETVLKSFNSSVDIDSSSCQKNDNDIQNNEYNKNIGKNLGGGSNENSSNTDNSNNRSNKLENNQNNLSLEINGDENQNQDEDYIFTISKKE